MSYDLTMMAKILDCHVIFGGTGQYSLFNLCYEGGQEKFYVMSYDETIMAKILNCHMMDRPNNIH